MFNEYTAFPERRKINSDIRQDQTISSNNQTGEDFTAVKKDETCVHMWISVLKIMLNKRSRPKYDSGI